MAEDSKKSILKQICSYSIENPDNSKPINYVMAGNGIFEIRKNPLGTFVRKTNNIGGLEKMQEKFNLSLPKIPISILLEIITFFKKVYSVHQSEAMSQIFWNKIKKEYFLYIPVQEVSGATADFTRDNELEKTHLLVADIHSHASMGAFFSGTDDGDEKETRIFGVIGKNDEEFPEIKFRVSVAGSYIDAQIPDIFDVSSKPIDDYMSKVTEKTYSYGNTKDDKFDYRYGYGQAWHTSNEFPEIPSKKGKKRKKYRQKELDLQGMETIATPDEMIKVLGLMEEYDRMEVLEACIELMEHGDLNDLLFTLSTKLEKLEGTNNSDTCLACTGSGSNRYGVECPVCKGTGKRDIMEEV